MSTERVEYDATGQGDIEMAVMRSSQLKEWIDGAVKERAEIAEKLAMAMEEHGANALVLNGRRVARIDAYTSESLTGDMKRAFIAKHPRLWKQFRKVEQVYKVVVGG